MKTASNSSGEPYECQQLWPEDMFVQCGEKGVVFVSGGPNYLTAFFEAFPNKPSCFLRGEGKTIQEAELSCWEKYQKVIACNHEMERRNRKDGYGYCKHCDYASMVFEPLTKCCKCGVPTRYTTNYQNLWFCKKHSQCMPKCKKPYKEMTLTERCEARMYGRLPRKEKKILKMAAQWKFRQAGIRSKVKMNYVTYPIFIAGSKQITLLFTNEQKQLLKQYARWRARKL